jgi:hypothetical protein
VPPGPVASGDAVVGVVPLGLVVEVGPPGADVLAPDVLVAGRSAAVPSGSAPPHAGAARASTRTGATTPIPTRSAVRTKCLKDR